MPDDLGQDLRRALAPDRVLTRAIDRIAFANDASVYRLVPRAVVFPATISDVQTLFRLSRSRRVPVTFRAAGTSLSGQAITDGILAVVSRHWHDIEVLDEGRRVRVQPGVIGGRVNQHLEPYGTKIGPDPASLNACMMGGILANNSSGMCCGVANNAYHTLESLSFVLPDGLHVDTSLPGAEENLARRAPDLCAGLLDLKRRVESDGELVALIRRKYGLKNTMGYSLNALLDHARPADMLSHLMIGSEGTLAFLAEAVLRTVPEHPLKYTGLLFFEDVPSACASIAALRDSGARALELMDRASLRAVEDQPGMPAGIGGLGPDASALLVEYQRSTHDEISRDRETCETLIAGLPLAGPPDFTDDPSRQASLWRVRKGLIPSVGAMRTPGTSFIIEDVVFPVERLARGVTDLQRLFAQHGYHDAIVFGHAKDGNLHFVLTQQFRDDGDVRRYDSFMHDLARTVVGYGGALKAEHGTGRNMAPFVEAEWGRTAYSLMRELKALIDPDRLLNPDVIVNEDPRAHVTHLKLLEPVEEEVDRCIECGFCERMCPSRELTLTPRQRIVVRREMGRLRRDEPGSAELRELERDYPYSALDTCAGDGMCALACPVSIDTGSLVRRLRRERHGAIAHEIADWMARHLEFIEGFTRMGLRIASMGEAVLGARAIAELSRSLWRVSGHAVPAWDPLLVAGTSHARPAPPPEATDVVYVPTCVTRVIRDPAVADGHVSATEAFLAVAERAGLRARVPDDARGICCGMPFASKGYDGAYRTSVQRMVDALWAWSGDGRIPIVMDASPCAKTLKQAGPDLSPDRRERAARLTILDGVEYAQDHLLPRLSPRRSGKTVTLHPVCSMREMGLVERLVAVAESCAENVRIPIHAGCCGFAGDKGLRVPELTEAATREEAAEVLTSHSDGYYSTSRTCEIGMRRATGRPYRSFWHLLHESSGPGSE